MSNSATKRRTTILLRALDAADIERTLVWHNDQALYSTLGTTFRFVSRTTEEDWLRKKSLFSPGEINLAICIRETGQHIGNIYLRDIDWTVRRASLHIFIGERQFQHEGLGRLACKCLLQHALEDLNLRRIYLEVIADNIEAIRLYKSLGFHVEGTLQQHAFKCGMFKDVLLMALLRDK